MPIIGNFKVQGGGFIGNVRALTFDVQVKFVPNDKTSEKAPDFRVIASGDFEIGGAWRKRTQTERRHYLSVTLDDPSLPAPINARLMADEAKKGEYRLMWSRKKSST